MTTVANVWCEQLKSYDDIKNYDSVLILSSRNDLNPPCPPNSPFLQCLSQLRKRKEVDQSFDNEVSFVHMDSPVLRMVHSPIKALDRDYHDVRCFADAANKGVKRVIQSGAKKLLVVLPSTDSVYKRFDVAALLGAYEALYVPLEIRDDVPSKLHKLSVIGATNFAGNLNSELLQLVSAIESGRIVYRDIGGSDPEKMAPPAVAQYVQKVFANTCIKVEVIDDEQRIHKEYPLLAAVDRATIGIDRHRARVIYLTYEPEGGYDTTVYLVGKGVTYDTGGADVKHGGHMAGMHRDKCGSAAVAGFLQALSVLKPKNIKVVGAMAMVRNSIGPNGYVADEIITSRAGKRIRIGNTDAEGRMAMGDVLCHAKEMAVNDKNAYLFTIATLTGHACLTYGDGYTAVIQNGPAKAEGVGVNLQNAGERIGDMIEVASLRREDYEFHEGKSEYEDLLQCNNRPSSQTARGHQTPAAFLIMASGLDKHGLNSSKPLKYCHLDIAASSGPFPGIPSGAPVAALVEHFLLRE